MTMRKAKRFLSLFLSVMMILSIIPGGSMMPVVNAAENPTANAAGNSIEYTGRKIKINDNWRFRHLSPATNMDNSLDAEASKMDYIESGTWNTVKLPHDWSIYREFENGTNGVRPNQGSLAAGTGWYRKTFTISDDFKGKNVVIQFDAVQKQSEIWINGTNLGKQFIGYNTFEYDITDYLRFDGQENVIAVKAFSSNSSERWYTGAGIQGSVYLIATEKVHIPVNGTYVTPVVEVDGEYVQPDFHTEPDLDALKKKSTVNVRAEVENKTAADARVSVKATVYSKENPNVGTKQSDPVTVSAGETIKIDQLIDIENPKLWSVDNPNLYWVKTEVIQNGKVVDTMDTRFGIRYIYLTPGSYTAPYSEDNTLGGMYINGVYTRINGVCEHRDIGALGLETNQAAIDRRIRKLKDMGVNVVRTAHNAVSPEYIEAADRLGMLIFEEGFDQWILSKNSQDYAQFFNKADDGVTEVFKISGDHIEWVRPDLKPNCVRDIQSMVDRDKNSPAIFLWSTGNEIYDTREQHGLDTQWLLATAIKEIDSLENTPYTDIINTSTKRTIRPTPAQNHAALPSASNHYTTDLAVRGGRYGRPISSAPPTWDSNVSQMIDNMALSDIGGHNYSRANNQYNTAKTRYPNMNFSGTETSSSFYTRGVYNIDHYKGGEGGFREAHSSGYASEWPFNRNFVTASITIREHRQDMMPFLYGEMVWTGHDYLGEPTPHGYPSRSSYFGIIDTAGFEKDAFYMYKSAWTDTPTVHLLPQKWNWDMGTQVPIMIYTNAASVEVFLNGRSLGVKEYDKKTASPVYLEYGYHTFEPGELKAVAKDAKGNIIATDTVYTAGEAQSVELSGDRSFIKNDGEDLLFVEAKIVDNAGNMLPTADNRVTFSVKGGEIVALDNGDPRDLEPFRGTNNNYNSNTSNNRKAFNGKVLAMIRATEGSLEDIEVTATASGSGANLSSNTLAVQVKDEVGDGTEILDYSKPEVTTGAGITPVLPETVGIIYDNGLIEQFEVDAWDLNGVKLNVPGTYTAYGTSNGISQRVEAIIHVKAVDSIDNVTVTTIAGVKPQLPRFVTVRYKDGETGAATVSWDSIKPSQYAYEGTFTVTGSVGRNMDATAEVIVKELESIEEITIHTVTKEIPVMPSTVNAKFTDGSEEKLGVEWNIQQNDVEYPGIVKVTGSVLGSDIEAIANVHVNLAVYASDLPFASESGTVNRDTMIDGNPLQARGMQGGPGEVYEKGIGTLAPATVEIDIAGKGYERFQSYVNLSSYGGGVTAPGAVSFKVFLDDAADPAYESPVMKSADEAILIDLDVRGKSKVRLVTEARGNDGAEHDLADWINTRFLSTEIAVDEVVPVKQIYTNNAGQIPVLPSSVQVAVPGIESPVSFKVEWPQLSGSIFPSGSVQPVYGKLIGTQDELVQVKVITDYSQASQKDGFNDKIGSWSEFEKFDWGNQTGDTNLINLNTATKTPRLIHSASSNMKVENVQAYGFEYGIYPKPAGSGNHVVFAVPGLSYFQIMNVANTAETSNNKSFTFETSTDGTNWTSFTGFTKGAIKSGTGTEAIWARRAYTSNEDAVFPEGTNFLRVTYPSDTTWQYNMTNITLKGGRDSGAGLYDTDLIQFKLGGYTGVVDHNAQTVSLVVPKTFDVTNITPEITVSSGAAVTPAGPQDFSNPVTYKIKKGNAEKDYVVSVAKGVNVSFNLYGGSIDNDTRDITTFVSVGDAAEAPAAEPVREGYLFRGWSADRTSKEPVDVGSIRITDDTVFYAVWEKDPGVIITSSADVGLKTWQTEKNTNYGSDGEMLMRMPSNASSHGQFGEKYNSTDTSDGTDMKTAFIRFPVAQLKGEEVGTVTLKLHYCGNGNPGGADTMKLRAVRADSDWKENQVTWTTRPKVYTEEGVVTSGSISVPKGNANISVEMDVTELLKNLPEGEEQITFAVSVDKSNHDYRLTSKEGAGANSAIAPKLVVTVEPEPDYSVTYDLNSGTGIAPIAPDLAAGAAFNAASAKGFTGPDGKHFMEWNTKPDGTGTGYQPDEEIVMPQADLTLYAIYEGSMDSMIQEAIRLIDAIDENITIESKDGIQAARKAYKVLRDTQKEQVTNYGKLEAAEEKLAEIVRVQNVIDLINEIGEEVTIESGNVIQAAREAFDALSEADQAKVTNAAVLIAAEKEYEEIVNGSVKNVIDLIDAIGEEVTLESEAAIQAARAAFDKLSQAQQAMITNSSKLTEAEEKLAELKKIQNVIDLIDAIDEEVTSESEEAIQAARAAFDKLSQAQQAMVTNASRLAEAEEKLAELKKIQNVIDLIDAIDEEVTIESGAAIQAAREAFNELSEEQQAMVTNAALLTAAEQKFAELVTVQNVIDLIHKIGENVTLESEKAIQAARAAFNELSEEQQAMVTNAASLAAAEEKLAELARVQHVIDLINKIGANVTLESEKAIQTARAAWNALSKEEQEQVTNIAVLTAAEKQLEEVKKNNVIYTVTLNPNGGAFAAASDAARSVKNGNLIGNLPVPTRADYNFKGWYTDITGGSAVSAEFKVTANITIYARWEKKPAVVKVGDTFIVKKVTYKVTKAPGSAKAKGLVQVVKASKNQTLKKVTIPTSVKHPKMNFSFTVDSIAKGAFKGSKKLTSVTVGNGVRVIGDSAFSGCKKLTKVTIGTNLTKIGKSAFYNDAKLKTIKINSKKLKTVGKKAFKNINKKAKIKVPKGKVETYKKRLKKGGLAKSVKVSK